MAKLGEVCDFYAGTGFPNEYQGRVTGKYPFYKVGDISKNVLEGNRELKTCANYVEEDVVQKLKGSILPPKTIVFAKIGEALKLNRRAITSCECLVDNNVMGIKAQNIRLNDEYLFYWLQNLNLSDYSESTTVPSVKKSRLQNIEINVSPLEEQEKVVSTLNKLSSLILARKKQLSKLDELVKARFVEMFGDPKDNRSNLVKIGEIGDLTSGGTPSRSNSEYFNGSIRWYSAGELNSLYLPDSIEHISRTALSQSAAKLFEKGTLMIGMYDTAAFKMGILTEQSSSNQACANLKPTEQYSVIWLYYLFDIMKPIFLNERQGVRQKNLSLSKIRNFNIPSAPLSLQNQFAAFVERVDQQKQTVQQSLEKLELMKKALMQEYFG